MDATNDLTDIRDRIAVLRFKFWFELTLATSLVVGTVLLLLIMHDVIADPAFILPAVMPLGSARGPEMNVPIEAVPFAGIAMSIALYASAYLRLRDIKRTKSVLAAKSS